MVRQSEFSFPSTEFQVEEPSCKISTFDKIGGLYVPKIKGLDMGRSIHRLVTIVKNSL